MSMIQFEMLRFSVLAGFKKSEQATGSQVNPMIIAPRMAKENESAMG